MKKKLPQFLHFYGDKVISNLLAAGVGAGFAYSMEFNKFLSGILDSLIVIGVPEADNMKSEATKFLARGNFATSLLLIGFVCTAVHSILPSVEPEPTMDNNSRGYVGSN